MGPNAQFLSGNHESIRSETDLREWDNLAKLSTLFRAWGVCGLGVGVVGRSWGGWGGGCELRVWGGWGGGLFVISFWGVGGGGGVSCENARRRCG